MTAAAPARPLGPAYRTLVEKIVRRPLRLAEQAIDVLGLDAALNRAKDELEDAIRTEMLRATVAWVNGAPRPTIDVTDEMLSVLNGLADLGRAEGLAELDRLGYVGIREPDEVRRYAADPLPPADRDLDRYLRRNLPALEVRIQDELVAADLSSASQGAIFQELLKVPGARDIASRIVSAALIDGLALTFEENADLVGCWEYTAVLDARTCPVCRSADGRRFDTLEAALAVMPNFGPNPACHGGGRCRCRLVPCDTAEVPQAAGGGEPEPEPAGDETPLTFATTREAEDWIVQRGLAREVDLGTLPPAGAREIADGLNATLGRHGVTINRLELDPTKKRSLARFRTYTQSDRGSIQVKRVVANAKTVTARAEKAVANYAAHRERAIADRLRQVNDATRPLPLREHARRELDKLEAATRWTVWETSARPTYSLIAHEAAHALEHNLALGNAWLTALRARGVTVADRYGVSEYGASSSSELFAEAVALRAEGRPMPSSVRAALDDVLPDAG